MVYAKLHKSIVHLEWENVEEALGTKKGKEMARESFKDDLPLHMAVDRRAPDQLVIALLDANKEAASVRGKMGSLPLHSAAQNCLSPNVIVALIKAYPEGLDVLNDNQCTPRDFHQRNDLSLEALMRPTACWVEDVEKEQYHERAKERREQLKKKLIKYREELANSKKKTAVASHLIGVIKPRLMKQKSIMSEDKGREEKLSEIREVLQHRLAAITERIAIMEENVSRDQSSEEMMISTVLKRSYMEEAQKKYERVSQSCELIKRDLEIFKSVTDENVQTRKVSDFDLEGNH